jgi:hypothetical protein
MDGALPPESPPWFGSLNHVHSMCRRVTVLVSKLTAHSLEVSLRLSSRRRLLNRSDHLRAVLRLPVLASHAVRVPVDVLRPRERVL